MPNKKNEKDRLLLKRTTLKEMKLRVLRKNFDLCCQLRNQYTF